MILLISTIVMGVITGVGYFVDTSPMMEKKIQRAKDEAEKNVALMMEDITKSAKDNVAKWEKTGLPPEKWKI